MAKTHRDGARVDLLARGQRSKFFDAFLMAAVLLENNWSLFRIVFVYKLITVGFEFILEYT